MDRKAFYQTFIGCFLYVLIGTIALFSLNRTAPLHGDWALYALFFTLPVTVVSFSVLFASSDLTILVLIIQFIMFILTWRIMYPPLFKRFKKKPL